MKNLRNTASQILLLAIGLGNAVGHCAEGSEAVVVPRIRTSPGPYCGINGVYAAARHYRKSVVYADLVQPRFVGSFQGSNLAELSAAVDSVGLASTPKAGMTIGDLRSLQYPSILLLSRHRDSVAFHHWVLVLHAGEDRVQVMESPGSKEVLTYAQLLAQWDGVALVVYPDSSTKLSEDRSSAASRWTLAIFAAVMALGLFAGRKCLPASLHTADFRPRRALLGTSSILVVGIVAALFWHAFAPTGFVRNAQAIALVKSRFFSRNLPQVSRAELAELIESNRAVVVDARFADSYLAGHIPSAINVPVHVSPTALQEFAQEIPRGKKVVVYCQSDQCEYDDRIGSQLHLLGVKDVALYHGGWKEWKAWKRRTASETAARREAARDP